MNSDQTQTLESSIPRRGRPPRKSSPQKTKSNGIRKPRPRAVKLSSANLQTADSNLTKVANKSSEIGKNFPVTSAKDSPPIATFILTTTNGKTRPLTPLSKSGSQPMNRVQYATSADTNSIKQVPIAVSSNILSRVQSSTSTASSPKLLLITTANNPAVSVSTTSANQTLCNTLLPVKLSNSTCNMNAVVAGNLGKPVLYQIPSSQGSGMVLVSSTVPLQSSVAPKNLFLIPSSTNTKRQSNASQISYSGVDCQPVIPIQTTSINHSPIDINKILNTSVPITSNLAETTSTKLTQQSSVNNRPTKRVNTSRRRGSIYGANSTISSIPSGIFKTVASTTNSRGICSTPVSIQISPKQSNVKITPVGGLVMNPLLALPMQQTSTHLTQDVFLNVTKPTVPEVSLKSNPLFTQSSDNNCCNSSSSSISTVNTCTISKTLSDSKQQTTDRKLRKPSKRSQAISGQRAKKTTSKIGQNKESSSSSLITVSSSLPFSTIQLKMNCSTTPASPFSGLSWVVSPNTGHQQQKSSLNSETQTKASSMPKKSKNMPKLIVVNGFSNSNFPTIPSTNSQTSKNDYQDGFFSASQYPKCSENTQPLYASPPKLTIAPGFSTPNQTGSESAKKKRPSELMIIKEREEFIDDSVELSPPKLQREEGTDLSGKFLFEMPTAIESAKLAEGRSIDEELASALSITNQSQQFCHEIKPIIREDNFPTLANLLASQNSKCSEFSSRLEQNKKLSFDQLFNHFKLLADKKKKSSSHSAIMFQVAYSIHCCVVLAKIDEDSVDVPFCVENSKCSVKCRQTFMKEVFAQKGISSLVDPRFSMSVLQSSDSTNDEWLAQCDQSKATSNLLSVNEKILFSSSAMPELSKIKVEFPESKKNSPDDQENLTNSFVTKKIATLTSDASKLATHIEEPFISSNSISPLSDSKCLKKCTPKPENVTSTNVNQPIHSLLSNDCSDTSSCTSSRTRIKNKGKCFCNGKCKKTDSSICLSQQKIKNVCSDTIQSSDILNVSSHSSNSQVLAGKLRYKIVPKGHISLSGKSSENESNCVGNAKEKRKFSVQSYIINGDKSSINPTQTISPVVAPSIKLYNAETKKLIGSNFNKKKKRMLPSPLKPSGENIEKKKICKSKMVAVPSMIKSAKASKDCYSRSSPSAKASLPLVERPSFVRDPKHLYDEPTTVDRVVMLTPDGKPILTGIDLQTLDPCLPSPKKRKKSSKREFLVKSSPTKQPSSSSCSIFKKSSSVKNKVQCKHSKSSSANGQVSRPPKLHVLLRELEQKCKYKYLSCSTPMTNSIQMNDSIFHQKTKKGKIEQIVTNIASGFPAFGSGHPRCTMKLYKYFVSSRLKNRAKKDGSHEMDAPLILYINWKTLSRQPFSKHRITNHTQNIMAIKNSKQLANFKKCKSRRQMCQPVKNKPLFMKRRKALLAVRNKKTKTNPSKLKQQTNKKYSRCLQSQSNKTKKQKTKTSSSKKKVSVFKLEKTVASKTEKADKNTELVPIAEIKKSKIDIKNKTLKSAEKKFKVPQLKQNKQVNKKETKKKYSSLPVQRSTRLRNSQHCDSEKIVSFYGDPNKIEKQSENHVVKKGLRRKAKLKPPEIWTKEMNKCKPLHHLNDEDLSLRMKSADLTVEKGKLVDIKQEIKSETDIQETNSVTEMKVSQLTRVKSKDPAQQGRQIDGKKSSSSKSKHHSKKTHEEVFFKKDNTNSDQALLLASNNDPVDENAKVVTLKPSSSPTITEDSGNFIFEDYAEPSLPTIDNSSMLCNENKPLNSLHNSLSGNNDQTAISNRNLSTSFINVTPAYGRSSAFSDKFDIGLSPELARIQKLKDQLQEKQKALDLAKYYLK